MSQNLLRCILAACLRPLFVKRWLHVRVLLLLPTVFAILMTTGCSLGYYTKAAYGHLSLMNERQDIAELLERCRSGEKCALSALEIEKLNLTQDIRILADDLLALPVADAYSTYVDTKRPYVVWNVFAAEEFSVEPIAWCYPIVGCASYRGYYDKEDAIEYAQGLKKEQAEVYVGGVRAYSSLGWFADPVLNTMINQQDVYIVSLLVHEIAHRVAYSKGDTPYNESFATAMEQFGVEVWLAQKQATQNSAQLDHIIEKYQQRETLHQAFIELVIQARSDLKNLYDQKIPDSEKRRHKADRFKQLKEDLSDLDRQFGLGTSYANWAEDINNAKIAPVNTYNQWVPAIRKRLHEHLTTKDCDVSNLSRTVCRDQLQLFYQEIQSVADLAFDERQDILSSWDAL